MARFSSAQWLCAFAALIACRDPMFHCESVGHVIGTATLSKDVPRQCHTGADSCEKQAPSCFEQPRAHCFRTYASYKHIFYCAPSFNECELLRRKREEGLYSAATESCKVVGPEQIENQ
jgi:hypothetical protein